MNYEKAIYNCDNNMNNKLSNYEVNTLLVCGYYISINGTPIIPTCDSEQLGAGLTTTHTFTVSGLTKVDSPHSICPYPN